MALRLDLNGIVADAIGPAGVSRAEIEALAPQAAAVAEAMATRRRDGGCPFLDLPYDKAAVTRVKALAEEVRREADTLVVLGIGGSALATRAMLDALGPPSRRVVVADNVDPWSFGALLDSLDLNRTTFNVISKSGETAETLAQFLIVRDLLLRTLGGVDHARRIVITTDAERGPLRQIVHDEGFRDLVVPAGVGGRFAALSCVGLFPAAVAGLKIDELLAGAAWMDERCREPELWRNPGFLLGSILHLADTRHGQRNVVLMPYSDRLQSFTSWFCQLWAETLGKSETLAGETVRVGQTPVAARGSTDQHSLLQLLVAGPPDKVVLMLRIEDHAREIPISSAYSDLDEIGYLGGAALGQLLNREQRGTELGLAKAGRPVITLTLPRLEPFVLGQLFYLFEVAAVFTAGLYGIDAFDQPGVEESKRLTYGLMGRRGFEAKRAEVEERIARKRPDWIL